MPTATDTRDRILHAALALANRQGIDAVSTRGVAAALDLSPGNVGYHFPRREDIVVGLCDELSERNAPLGELVLADLHDLLDRYRRALEHQWQHRGIVVALPSLVETYPAVRRRYRATERERYRQQRRQLAALREAGRLDADDEQLDRLVATIGLIARFWLSEQRTTWRGTPVDAVIDHYLSLIAGVLWPYATPPGRAELAPALERLLPLPTD